MTIRLIVADAHQMFLDALSSYLNDEPNLKVVATVRDGRTVKDLYRSLRPDIVVMSDCMSGMNGIEVTRRLVAEFPKIKVIALSALFQKLHVLSALEAGACAYLIKENSASELVSAVNAVMKGQKYLCTEAVNVVVNHSEHNPMGIVPKLGPREREVLQLLAEGDSSPIIGKRLFISTSTVDVHRRNIMKKLDLHNVAELTKYAVRNGMTQI